MESLVYTLSVSEATVSKAITRSCLGFPITESTQQPEGLCHCRVMEAGRAGWASVGRDTPYRMITETKSLSLWQQVLELGGSMELE